LLNFKMMPSVFRKNVSLAEHTTFKIGGKAKYFFVAKTKNSLIKALRAAKEYGLPFFVLGGGSNVLVSDKLYNGLVIKIKNQKPFGRLRPSALRLRLEEVVSKAEPLKIINRGIYVEAGASLAQIVKLASEKGLAGLEWASGIPGTIGGAIKGNAGAFGGSIADAVNEVEAYDSASGQIKMLTKNECRFNYKDSIFKRDKNLVILSAVFTLKAGDKNEIGQKMKEYIDYRKARHPLNLPSAGCIFENPPGYRAAELIENCGLKGKTIGGAQISEKHANFIVNVGRAKAADVSRLIALIKKKVKEKYGIKLEEEIQRLNFGV